MKAYFIGVILSLILMYAIALGVVTFKPELDVFVGALGAHLESMAEVLRGSE